MKNKLKEIIKQNELNEKNRKLAFGFITFTWIFFLLNLVNESDILLIGFDIKPYLAIISVLIVLFENVCDYICDEGIFRK